MIEDINRRKWMAIYAFLIMDVVQILFVSLLTIGHPDFIISFDPTYSNPIISVALFIGIGLMQLAMLYIMARQMLRQKDLIKLYPDYNKETEWRSRYSHDDIVNWTQELAKQSEVEVSKIYLMNSPLPNAFTFSLPLIGSVVVVHSNTLDVLNEDEVKAIITHELGHIANRDSLVQIFARMPSLFIDLIYLYIYITLGVGVASAVFLEGSIINAGIRLAILGTFFILSRVLAMISKLFMQKASRDAELMSDYHAASVLGHESTINALIRLGQRVEAITVLIEEVRWLESLNPERARTISNEELMRIITHYPLDGIDEVNARLIAPGIFLSTRLKHMREVYGIQLTDKQIQNAVEPAVASLQKKRVDVKPTSGETKDIQIVDWREVDFDEDRRLSGSELTELLKMLRENPTKMLFDREVGVNLLTLDHPDFRRRVLFIADEFGV
ncbi:MAG: M48 family metalloprotease [Candidatus Thorarchaeota archaeon]|jgi:Zn-dependent protease with chaperone function